MSSSSSSSGSSVAAHAITTTVSDLDRTIADLKKAHEGLKNLLAMTKHVSVSGAVSADGDAAVVSNNNDTSVAAAKSGVMPSGVPSNSGAIKVFGGFKALYVGTQHYESALDGKMPLPNDGIDRTFVDIGQPRQNRGLMDAALSLGDGVPQSPLSAVERVNNGKYTITYACGNPECSIPCTLELHGNNAKSDAKKFRLRRYKLLPRYTVKCDDCNLFLCTFCSDGGTRCICQREGKRYTPNNAPWQKDMTAWNKYVAEFTSKKK